MSRLKLLAILICLIGIMAMTATDAQAATINISGTHTYSGSSYRPFEINTSVLFDPLSGPVTVTGTVDLNGVPGNSSLFVGLISKIDYDSWIGRANDPNDPSDSFFGFVDTAYAAFNTSNGGRLGLGQYLPNGDITQAYVVNSGLGLGEITDFVLTFEATTFSLTHPSGNPQSNRPYVDTREFFGPGIVPTDWSEGAYAFVSAFYAQTDFAPEFDVTFNGPSLATAIPEPSSMAMLVIGTAGLASIRLGRRRKRIAD